MIDFSNFYQLIAKSPLSHWLETLPAQVAAWQRDALHGKFREWERAVEFLPELTPWRLDLLHSVTAESETPLSEGHQRRIENLLKNLMPWRKGPYSLYGINIDTEWRSDWKWERVLPHLSDLTGRTILDVGCGSGYHMWRMIGAGAHLAVGIDPTQLFLCQFEAVRKLLGNDQRAHLLPLGIEQLPALEAFDTVFSMGVLYHRRSPLGPSVAAERSAGARGRAGAGDAGGLKEMKIRCWYRATAMRKCATSILSLGGGPEIVAGEVRVIDVRIVDACVTSTEEQRRTEWMTTESLADFLDPQDQRKTVEGYPAPLRAVIIATKPETQQSLAKKAR
ncbi:tRNA (5-methoxyuridine) 34 synthase [Klebsiella pneumoniae]|uniref:tRNA (5-methoxyuridine) 34 synthase n=1 Tax=Klebsiella pneumoniae TaxID=573 RepID=A0A378AVB9_KLEPN|nr:tRNA (5-methoxyuridine) 34 synthase [Klebsiella pneumoniae]